MASKIHVTYRNPEDYTISNVARLNNWRVNTLHPIVRDLMGIFSALSLTYRLMGNLYADSCFEIQELGNIMNPSPWIMTDFESAVDPDLESGPVDVLRVTSPFRNKPDEANFLETLSGKLKHNDVQHRWTVRAERGEIYFTMEYQDILKADRSERCDIVRSMLDNVQDLITAFTSARDYSSDRPPMDLAPQYFTPIDSPMTKILVVGRDPWFHGELNDYILFSGALENFDEISKIAEELKVSSNFKVLGIHVFDKDKYFEHAKTDYKRVKLPVHQIWTEGYLGENGLPVSPFWLGSFPGRNFDDAVATCFQEDQQTAELMGELCPWAQGKDWITYNGRPVYPTAAEAVAPMTDAMKGVSIRKPTEKFEIWIQGPNPNFYSGSQLLAEVEATDFNEAVRNHIWSLPVESKSRTLFKFDRNKGVWFCDGRQLHKSRQDAQTAPI